MIYTWRIEGKEALIWVFKYSIITPCIAAKNIVDQACLFPSSVLHNPSRMLPKPRGGGFFLSILYGHYPASNFI